MSIVDNCKAPQDLVNICGLACSEFDLPKIRTILLTNWQAAAFQRKLLNELLAAGYKPIKPLTKNELADIEEASKLVDVAGGTYNQFKTVWTNAIFDGPKMRDAAIMAHCAAAVLKAAVKRITPKCDPIDPATWPEGYTCVEENGAWTPVPSWDPPKEPDPNLPPPDYVPSTPAATTPSSSSSLALPIGIAVAGGLLWWFLKK